MPFHHVTAGLLYKGNYLNRSLSAGSDSEQLANISVEELDGEWGCGVGTAPLHLPAAPCMAGSCKVGQLSRSGTEKVPDQSCAVILFSAFVLLQLFETLSLHFMGKMGKLRLMLSQRFSFPWDSAELSLYFPPNLICFEAFLKGGSSPCLSVRRCMEAVCGLRRWKEL